MSERHDRLRELLRRTIEPARDVELEHDLWPRMLRKLQEPRSASWLDWALIALAALWLVAFPQAILALLYHL